MRPSGSHFSLTEDEERLQEGEERRFVSQREVDCLTSGPWMGLPTTRVLHPCNVASTKFKGMQFAICTVFPRFLVWSCLQINLAKNSPHRQEENT